MSFSEHAKLGRHGRLVSLLAVTAAACNSDVDGGGSGAADASRNQSGATTSVTVYTATGAGGAPAAAGTAESSTTIASTGPGPDWPECADREPDVDFTFAVDLDAWYAGERAPGRVEIDAPCTVVGDAVVTNDGLAVELQCAHSESPEAVAIPVTFDLPADVQLPLAEGDEVRLRLLSLAPHHHVPCENRFLTISLEGGDLLVAASDACRTAYFIPWLEALSPIAAGIDATVCGEVPHGEADPQPYTRRDALRVEVGGVEGRVLDGHRGTIGDPGGAFEVVAASVLWASQFLGAPDEDYRVFIVRM